MVMYGSERVVTLVYWSLMMDIMIGIQYVEMDLMIMLEM